MRASLLIILMALVCAGCAGDKDSAHTTATTIVPPPARQVLHVETRPSPKTMAFPVGRPEESSTVALTKPLLILNLEQNKTIREGEEVVIDFSLANAILRGEGGEFRVRYGVDDDDMEWIDRWEQVVLTGWLPGKYTIRVELVGPDGWPYRNGDFNIETRELTVVK